MADADVRAQTARLKRAFAAQEGDLWLQFVPDHDSDQVEAAVAEAIEQANLQFATGEGAEDGWDAGAAGPWVPPTGPRVYQAHEVRGGTIDAFAHWLDTFVGALRAAGLTGTVTVAPKQDHPSYGLANQIPPHQLTAFVAYSLATTPVEPFSWNVAPDVTGRICRHIVRAGDFPDAETYLFARRLTRMAPDAAADALPGILPRSSSAQLTFLRPAPPRVLEHRFQLNGRVTRVVYDPMLAWRDRLAACIDLLTGLPDQTAVGLVEPARSYLSGWEAIGRGAYGLPATLAAHFRYHAALLPEYVPDARGVMVLTDAHLAKAHDLTGWTITDLGHGRHLVQHHDLAAWYADPDHPDPALLPQARADLGDMILTADVLRRHPMPPWRG